MNIKRAFIALGAMLLGVGFFGASTSYAYVGTPQTQGNPLGQQVTCCQEELAYDINHWPGNHYWYCGTNEPANGQAPKGYLSSMNSSKTPPVISGRKAWFDNQIRFFVFEDATAYHTFCTGSVISPVGAPPLITNCIPAASFTVYDRGATRVTGGDPHSVVVEKSTDAPSGTIVNEWSPAYIHHNILHEAGHHEDHYLVNLLSWPAGTPVSLRKVNTSNEFASALTKDWAAINNADASNPVGLRNGCYNLSGSGMFINKRDKNNAFICNNSGAGPFVNTTAGYTTSWNNEQVLKKAWPYIYEPNASIPTGQNAELASSIFSAYNGSGLMGPGIGANPGNQDQGTYLGQFGCLARLLGQLNLNGNLSQCP